MKNFIASFLVAILCFSFAACGVCNLCNGEKRIKCPDCFEGKVDCENCHFGLIEPVGCNVCNGKKFELVDCSRCNGSGKIVNPVTWQSFVCTNCDGKMYEIDYCDQCNGEGMLGDDCEICYDGTLTCEACEGNCYQDCTACE